MMPVIIVRLDKRFNDPPCVFKRFRCVRTNALVLSRSMNPLKFSIRFSGVLSLASNKELLLEMVEINEGISSNQKIRALLPLLESIF